MRSFHRILLTLTLLGPVLAFAGPTPSSTWVKVPLSEAQIPGQAFFSTPPVNSTSTTPLHASAPASAVAGLSPDPAPQTFKTMKEAAAAGVNPFDKHSLVPARVLVLHSASAPRRARWPIVFGFLSLIFCVLVGYVGIVTRGAPSKEEEAEEAEAG